MPEISSPRRPTHIDPEETVENVHDRLADLGGRLLVQTVAELAAGTARRIPQDHSQATLAPYAVPRALSHRLEQERAGHP